MSPRISILFALLLPLKIAVGCEESGGSSTSVVPLTGGTSALPGGAGGQTSSGGNGSSSAGDGGSSTGNGGSSAGTGGSTSGSGGSSAGVGGKGGSSNQGGGGSGAAGKGGTGGQGGSTPSGPENTAALCSDGQDNDGDKYVDCNDFDCCALVDCKTVAPTSSCAKQGSGGGTGAENTAALCSDGQDNDGDNFKDCGDKDCCSLVDCSGQPGSYCAKQESSISACSDGQDNDGDSYTDCEDSGCCAIVDCKTLAPTSFCGKKAGGQCDVGSGPCTTPGQYEISECTSVGAFKGPYTISTDYAPLCVEGKPGCSPYLGENSVAVSGTIAGGDSDACSYCRFTVSGGFCGSASAACDQAPECKALNDCTQTCQDAACVAACKASHPSALDTFNALWACECQACAKAGGICGGSNAPAGPCSAQCGG